ncbi:DUF3999 domain-containing protein [Acidovorax sp. ACV01]|uniref:DUF3999 domain-containing protein n=1 Tax=Acidovorax sp. ACV01 TaxID=2769311 RepID=UPI00177D1EF7|nr:DUF3999 domain-containing protein [Acidovorax sp. ACV01]MBD9392969.1 DUF3999 domain-containing protein [Acidovorax sp. ACV01]
MKSPRHHLPRPLAAWLAAAALSLAAGGVQAAADANSPAAYAIRIPVTLAADAPLQRVLLPAEVLVRLQNPGYADVRLFNGAGQPVPMALAGVAAASAPEESVVLPAFPILGAPGMPGQAGLEGLSLRVEEQQGRRVVQIDTAGTAGTPGTAGAQTVRGALLDARSVQLPVARMALDADLPAGQPVTFRVQASRDLKNWRPLAETVLYRADAAGTTPSPAAPGRLGSEHIDLQRADLKDHYLRVTWGDAAVTFRGATLVTSRGAGPRERVSASMAVPPLGNNPRELVFALPFATPVAALKITPQGSNVLVPVRVLGRNDRERPWAHLASATVYRMSTGGKEQTNAPVELGGASVREVKIEADAKSAGFAAAPDIALQFEPAQLVFLASGQGPFTLAAGLPGARAAASAFLPLASLVPDYQPQQENTLPLALADVARADITGGKPAVGPLVAAATASDGLSMRSWVLWAVLLAGVGALGLMAWLLMRQTKPASQPAIKPASKAPDSPHDAV